MQEGASNVDEYWAAFWKDPLPSMKRRAMDDEGEMKGLSKEVNVESEAKRQSVCARASFWAPAQLLSSTRTEFAPR